jgi:hypothetical protein
MVETTSSWSGAAPAHGFDLAPERAARRAVVGAGVLGPCAFVARYGLPSPTIDAWIRAGAHRFARLRRTAVTRPRTYPESAWPYQLASVQAVWLRACRAGRMDVCRRFMLDGSVRREGRDTFDSDVGSAGRAAFDMQSRNEPPAVPTLLADLEQEFGPERFARFWNGQGTVEEAFAAAFGMDIGEWTRDWSRRADPGSTLAARLDAGTVLLALLTTIALAAIAAIVALRRQIR